MNIKHQAETLLRKITSVFSIITIILVTSFGAMNSANALDGQTNTIAANATIAAADLDDSGTSAITTGDQDIIVDEANIIDVASVDISVDTIRAVDDGTADSLTLKLGAGMQTFTVQETIINAAGEVLTIIVDDEGTNILELQGAATGVAANQVILEAEATTTIKLSGSVAHSAIFRGAGKLQVTGTVSTDEAIGSTKDMGIIDIDGQITSTSTIKGDVLDLDGTIAGATSLTIDLTGTLNGSITTTGATKFLFGAVTLDGNSMITTTGNGDTDDIDFGESINGAKNLTLTAGDGVASDITITGVVGALTDVTTLTMTGNVITTAAVNSDGLISVTNSGTSTMGALGGTGSLTKAGAGKLTLSGVNTLTGDVIISAGTLEVDATLANTTNVSVAAGAIYDVDAADTIASVSGAGNIQLGANLTTGDAGNDTLSGIISGTGDLIKAGAGTLTITGNNTTTGKLDIDVGTVILSGSLDGAIDLAAGATIILDDTIVANAVVSATGNDGAVTATSVIKMPVNLKNLEKIVWADGADNAGIITTLNTAVQDNALFNYVVTDSGDDTEITANAKTAATTASELGVTANQSLAIAQALASAINDTVADATALDAFSNALNAEGDFSATEDTALAKQVSVQDDLVTGSTFATKAMTGTVQGIVASRMASLRSGDAYVSGIATDNHMSANSMFLQAFGSMSEQDNKRVGSGTQFGYEADTAGLAIGADGLLSNGSVLGLSLSMSNTDVDGKGTGRAKNDIDSYTASLYMDKATAAGYIEGSLTYGINENSSSRIINTAGLNRTYSADYDSDQISLKIGGGIPNDIGDNTFITPFGSLTATKISTDAYTETSNTADDSLRLRVAQDDVDSFVGTIGIKAHKVTDQGTPMISLAINNEFGDNTISSTNTYQGGGTAFNTSTDVEELSATLALGYKFGSDKLSFTLGYEATANDDDYLSHYGSAKLVSKF